MNPRIDDLIALAALGELTGQEAQELDDAARADPLVAAELAGALTSAAALQSSEPEPPPAGLKMSVMDAIAGVAQDPPVQQTSTAPEQPPSDNGAALDRGAEVRPIESARRRRRLAPLIAVAAAILVVIGAVVVATNAGDGDNQSQEIAAVVEADDAVAHSVRGSIGELEFVYSPGEDAFVIVGESVKVPPDDSTYQLWMVDADGPKSLGTFEPDADGEMEMRGDGVDPTGTTIAVTMEPEGGSEEPTMPLLAQSA